MTDPWQAFRDELDLWAEAGQTATLWWRDDDATEDTPDLRRLLDVAGDTPITLAVVPQPATEGLAAALAPKPSVTPVQHGYGHLNHAPADEKKMELGGHRPADIVAAELAMGADRLQRLFGAAYLPVMVPPWNRIAPHLVPYLAELRYLGLSTYGARGRAQPVAGLQQVNCHGDLIDWPGTRGFVGDAVVLGDLTAHLAARRAGTSDDGEPTGLLTHHLAHDEACWTFLAQLLQETADHPAATWLGARDIFEAGP